LRVLVVNEPELVEEITRLRGEWAEQATGELTAAASSWNEVAAAKSLDADVVIFPSRYLGELCTRGWLRPVRPNALESDDLHADDFFPIVRQHLIKWGGEEVALPLGIQSITGGDKVEAHPALSLLALAAPRAVTHERLGVLFDAKTMKPRITEPAFVAALAEMTAAIHQPVGTSTKVSPSSDAVPVLGYADRLVAVTASSRNAASAFKLLAWLAQADVSAQLARAGDGVLPVRRSTAASARWYDANTTAEQRRQLAETLEQTLGGERFLMIPRIPGVNEYLGALDEAVNASIRGGLEPKDALEKAAQRWEEITNTRGRDRQREAYLNHLNVGDR
jgi:hypothetical protein